ncbi:MAG: dihydrofolate reductase family protein [Vicinamibacterales bacterium]
MRTVIYGGACSLDGFLAGPDGAIDWLHFSADVQAEMTKSFARADALVFGRKTWDTAVASGGGGAMPGVKGYVCSRTLTSLPDGSGVELVTGDAAGFVRDLKQRPGKDILIMSGGSLARSLLAVGVIDEIGLNVHPVLLGSGVPAFLDCGTRVPLALKEARTLDGGCVLVTYRVGPLNART